MAIKKLSISLQEEQLNKIEMIRSSTNNPDLENEFIAGLLLNTLLRDEPSVLDYAIDLVAPFKK